MDLNFTVEQVKQVLEEALDLIWIDKLRYNHKTKCYHTATITDFKINRYIYAYLINNKRKAYLAKIQVDNEKFLINVNGMKIDATEHWQEILGKENVATIN